MAYIIRRPGCSFWNGPFPNKEGEFAGNIESRFVMDRPSSEGYRYGKPAGKKRNSEDYVGVYLEKDVPVSHIPRCSIEEIREVDTDVLQEEVVTGQRESLIPFNPGVEMNPYNPN